MYNSEQLLFFKADHYFPLGLSHQLSFDWWLPSWKRSRPEFPNSTTKFCFALIEHVSTLPMNLVVHFTNLAEEHPLVWSFSRDWPFHGSKLFSSDTACTPVKCNSAVASQILLFKSFLLTPCYTEISSAARIPSLQMFFCYMNLFRYTVLAVFCQSLFYRTKSFKNMPDSSAASFKKIFCHFSASYNSDMFHVSGNPFYFCCKYLRVLYLTNLLRFCFRNPYILPPFNFC